MKPCPAQLQGQSGIRIDAFSAVLSAILFFWHLALYLAFSLAILQSIWQSWHPFWRIFMAFLALDTTLDTKPVAFYLVIWQALATGFGSAHTDEFG